VRAEGSIVILSATDVSNALACRHRFGLDLAAAQGRLPAPPPLADPAVVALRERGEAHERAYLESLRRDGLTIVEIPRDASEQTRVARTIDALRSGADVVYQAAFAHAQWTGSADLLRKVPCAPGTSSAFGNWSYEPYETKLTREVRGGAVVQLALYADLIARVQGIAPERFYVVTPGRPFTIHEHRLTEYGAYFRSICGQTLDLLGQGADAILSAHYPEPVDQCDVCRWSHHCDQRRRADDHASLIAGSTRAHRAELAAQGFATLAATASLSAPLPFTPARGSREVYERLADQARMQLQQRTTNAPAFKVLPIAEGDGLCRLPAPSPGDLFLDLEGARFVGEGGHEYLFGLGHIDASTGTLVYRAWWAMTPAEERQALEQVIDTIVAARAADPGMHVYHFASYEPAALKRLVGRYATRPDALDDLLRGERFVDLYTIVRQAVRAGVESYSIKQLEQFYGYARSTSLRMAASHLQTIELALEAGMPEVVASDVRTAIERYNEDDVRSTRGLRDWLEARREELAATGVYVPRPASKQDEEAESNERALQALALRETLLDGVAPEASEPGHPRHPRWLLAYLIDWHHREEKADWWEYFRLRNLPEDDLLHESNAIAGLRHLEVVGPVFGKNGRPTGSTVHRYAYPFQELELGVGTRLKGQDDKPFGEVVALDRLARIIDVKRGRNGSGAPHPTAAFACDVFNLQTQQQSVMRFAERMRAADDLEISAGADLLLRRTPRLRDATPFAPMLFAPNPGESAPDFAVRVVTALDRTTLAIQGPPGTGKTYVGARMIRALVSAGKRVGVTANSHKVIQNLLDAVRQQAEEAGESVRLGRKVSDEDDAPADVVALTKNPEALGAIAARRVDVLGGTAWLWADEQAVGAVDVLFVDEAGQMSLANVLAVAQSADSVVLLGDPRQLDQPKKASHPDGVNVSALAHVVGDAETMTADRGIFMTETWRLAPRVCEFTSELFYQGKLQSKSGLERQRLQHTDGFDGAGLWWIPVVHQGNRSASIEEVEVVARLVERLLRPDATWVDEDGVERALTMSAVRVVAPYNAQVNRLAARLSPLGIEVGTVDRFQGQTCAVVIYSMATSSADEAPRGMGFLYSLNRLNVATSRARCAAFIVGSPGLLEPSCRTPSHMRLANGLCRYVELARLERG